MTSKKEEIKEIKIVEEQKIENDKIKSAAFVKRFTAFILDMIIVSMITSLLTLPIPTNNNAEKLSDELQKSTEEYTTGKIDMKTYINRSADISYDMSKENGLSTIIYIAVLILYFVVYQGISNGITIGKRLLKIKVVKIDDSELTMNDLLLRSSLNNLFLVETISICITMFCNKNMYLALTGSIEFIFYSFMFISAIMILSRKDKRGLHDIIAKTKVVEI